MIEYVEKDTEESVDIEGIMLGEEEEAEEEELTISIIKLPLQTIDGIDLDQEEFKKGVKEYSNVAGAISALVSAGAMPSEALEFVLNYKAVEANVKMNKDKCKAQVDASKHMLNNFEDARDGI